MFPLAAFITYYAVFVGALGRVPVVALGTLGVHPAAAVGVVGGQEVVGRNLVGVLVVWAPLFRQPFTKRS